MKKLGFMIVFLLSLLVSSSFVNSGVSLDYSVEKVEVDGTTFFDQDGVNLREVLVERGDSLPVDIWVRAFNDIDNVRVEISLKGYEGGLINANSEIFELDSGTAKKVPLVLNLPSDLDASETYTLVVEVSDRTNGVLEEFSLRVKEKRHLLNVLDVIFRPSSTVEAGRFLRTVVRVENLGAKAENDIKVSVSIPELGVSTRDYIDELVQVDEDEDDDESSLSTNELILQIPKDAKEGDYEARIDVEYNRGNDIVSLKKSIHVSGTKEVGETQAIISVDSTSKTVAKSEEGVFRVTFANLADERKLYNVEVAGTETWADIALEPSFLSVGASETGSILVRLSPKEDAALGAKVFTLKVKEDNVVVKEINLNTDVKENATGIGSFRRVLEVLFAVLIVVLIVLALVIAFRRVRGREQGPGVETNTEQTYY